MTIFQRAKIYATEGINCRQCSMSQINEPCCSPCYPWAKRYNQYVTIAQQQRTEDIHRATEALYLLMDQGCDFRNIEQSKTILTQAITGGEE